MQRPALVGPLHGQNGRRRTSHMLWLLCGDELRRHLERSPSIGGSVGAESVPSFLEYAANLLLYQNDSHHRQPASKVSFDHLATFNWYIAVVTIKRTDGTSRDFALFAPGVGKR